MLPTLNSQIKVLLVEDNEADAKLLRQLLSRSSRANFQVRCADRLSTGMELLKSGDYDIVLLDLGLPDAQGLDTFRVIHSQFPSIPVIVMTGLDDESVAFDAVAAGAQDYLVKGQIPGGLLVRAVLYAIERNQTNEKVKQLNLELEKRIIQLASANSELAEANRIAELTRDQALQASNFKSEFVAKMSHEVRTPISALIGVLDLLKVERSAAETKDLLRMAEESAHFLLSVINDVLDLSKIEAGKIELKPTDFSTTALVEEVGDLFVPLAQKKKIRILTFVDSDIPALIEGDPIRLRQVLLNFLSNAVKFTEQGEIVLRATVESADPESINVRFSVTDTGCGIAEKEIERLFQPFVQVGSSRSAGTGLGLSICKRLVELMGGQVGLESVDGKGSTFWMSARFPRSKNYPRQIQFHFNHAQQLTQTMRVLVVADNLTMRDILHQYVCAAGLRNGSAANAYEAFDMIRHADLIDDPYKLAVVDLATLDAFAFSSELHEDPTISATPLLFVAKTNDIDKVSALNAGFNGYIREPVHQAEFVEAILTLIGPSSKLESDESKGQKSQIRDFAREAKSKTKILVVEDNLHIQKLIYAQLEQLGISATIAANGKEAVSQFSKQNYSLILMDINMPEMSGLDAARAIRELEAPSKSHIPIIALTARTMEGDRQKCLEAGMDDYLAKPVTLEQLKQVIQRWMIHEAELL